MYIGADSSDNHRRWSTHKTNTRKFLRENIQPSIILYQAMTKYGISNFEYEVIDNNAKNWDQLMELEIFYIEKYNTFKGPGYNMTPGGEGVKLDESWFSRLSEIEQSIFRKKIAKVVAETWMSYSPEERLIRCEQISLGTKRKIEAMTAEEYVKFCYENYKPLKKYREGLTDKEIEKSTLYMQKKWKEWFDNLTKKEKAQFKAEKNKGLNYWWESLTDKEKEQKCTQRSQQAKNWWSNMDWESRNKISEKIAIKKRKKYIAVSPDGGKFHTNNLAQFCEENNIDYRAMGMKSRNQRKALVNGWDCIIDDN